MKRWPILLILLGYSAATGEFAMDVDFMFKPDWTKVDAGIGTDNRRCRCRYVRFLRQVCAISHDTTHAYTQCKECLPPRG